MRDVLVRVCVVVGCLKKVSVYIGESEREVECVCANGRECVYVRERESW